ncbi:YitT family protein [Effusibacillus pohliae]|uniref:YitT family protein n=1 Tax=Effusibacillus pohliae TaxID=232270 RepID=UPI000476572A|nr:YitT family protein [Effusibacillus pohliae]
MSRIINVILGCMIVSLGVILLHHSHLVTGGTAGLALSLTYLSGIPFSAMFFLINIPFYALSILRMGWGFTLSTVFAVTILSFITGLEQWLPDFTLSPLIGGAAAGIVIGLGLSLILLNRASLGGANILALYLQKKLGWDPGKINFLFDFAVVLSGIYSVGWWHGLCSILSIYLIGKIVSSFKHRIAAKHAPSSPVTPPSSNAA